MFRATNSPILRSTFWLYIQLLLQWSDSVGALYQKLNKRKRCHNMLVIYIVVPVFCIFLCFWLSLAKIFRVNTTAAFNLYKNSHFYTTFYNVGHYCLNRYTNTHWKIYHFKKVDMKFQGAWYTSNINSVYNYLLTYSMVQSPSWEASWNCS